MMVNIVSLLLIYIAFLASPFYGLWIFGGYLADKRAQRKRALI